MGFDSPGFGCGCLSTISCTAINSFLRSFISEVLRFWALRENEELVDPVRVELRTGGR